MDLFKRLISLNLSIIMCLSLFGLTPIIARADSPGPSSPPLYIRIDGVTYDATESHSGTGWEFTCAAETQSHAPELVLQDYNAGSVYTNLGNIGIYYWGVNTITAGADEYGICTENEAVVCFRFDETDDPNPSLPHLTVVGATGKAAVKANKFSFGSFFTAQGGGVAALDAEYLDYLHDDYYNKDTSSCMVGNSASDAAIGIYLNQPYVSYTLAPHLLTLNGNGGFTLSSEDHYVVRRYYVTSDSINLYDYENTLSKENSTLLGWQEDNANGKQIIWDVNALYRYGYEQTTSTLNAIWDDNETKGIILKDFYGQYKNLISPNNSRTLEGGTVIERVSVGSSFVLPAANKGGNVFLGWKDDNNQVHPAGESIIVNETITLTAVYDEKTIKINGLELNAGDSHGSQSDGYFYSPMGSSPSGVYFPCHLTIYSNYSGEPIEASTNIYINLQGSVTGVDTPAITVDGDVEVVCWNDDESNPIQLKGGVAKPAIQASGSVTFITASSGAMVIVGGDDASAIEGTRVICENHLFMAGSDQSSLVEVGKYNNEHYIFAENNWYYERTFVGDTTIPSVPEHDLYTFLAWLEGGFQNEPLDRIWYLPGDAINAGTGVTLTADYLHNNGTTEALIVDGNGFQTAKGSKYYIAMVSPSSLKPFTAPSNPFVSGEQALLGYNTAKDGTGTSYLVGSPIPSGGNLITRVFAQWGFAINYYANGGRGTMDAQPFAAGATVVISNNQFTRSNYSFVGWNTAADGSGIAYRAGQRLTLSNSLDLYAQWSYNGSEIYIPPTIDDSSSDDPHSPNQTTTTINNPDGSTTTIVKNSDGSSVETTKQKDGTTIVISTDKDGAKTITTTLENGLETTEKIDADGKVQIITSTITENAAQNSQRPIEIPISVSAVQNAENAVPISISIPENEDSTTILIPITNPSLTTVVVLVNADGTEEILKTTIPSSDGVVLTLHESTTLKVIDNAKSFDDVPESKWSYDAISFAASRELFEGVGKNWFAPDSGMTRGMFLAVLARLDGVDAFGDDWEEKAVAWGIERGITDGSSPDYGIDRQQIVTMLWRYAGEPKPSASLAAWKDSENIADYAVEAMSWAVECGILHGTAKDTLSPNSYASREQVAQFLMNYIFTLMQEA